MTGKWRRILIVLVIVCLIGVGIFVYRILHMPDGQLAYRALKGRVCLVSGLRTRCKHYQSFFEPDLPPLPSGSTFLDVYERTGLLGIGGEESILLTEAALVHYLYPRWSPDRQLIAYSSNEPGICLADADGTDEQCYPTDYKRVGGISWSPDGQQIAFSRHRSLWGNGDGWDVFIFDLDTRTYTLLITDADDPSWSPDGRQMAFTSDRTGNNEIYTIDVDGNNLRRITNHPADDHNPVWSPDGDRIAFLSDRGGGTVYLSDTSYSKKRIYIVDAEGGQARVLISRPFDSIERFVWGE